MVESGGNAIRWDVRNWVARQKHHVTKEQKTWQSYTCLLNILTPLIADLSSSKRTSFTPLSHPPSELSKIWITFGSRHGRPIFKTDQLGL